MSVRTNRCAPAVAALVGLVSAGFAGAAAVRMPAGFDANSLERGDDDSLLVEDIGFDLGFGGLSQNSLYINMNGSASLSGPVGAFDPVGFLSLEQPIFAPFFADVDTTFQGNAVTYGNAVVNDRDAFLVNWIGVARYLDFFEGEETSSLNSFQLVIIDRSDTGAGNFDFEFNYDEMNWESGDASGSDDQGLGGNTAFAGFSNGLSGEGAFSFEFDGSAIPGSLVDGGANALVSDRYNSDQDGRYFWGVRGGVVIPAPGVSSLALFGLGVAGRRRRR